MNSRFVVLTGHLNDYPLSDLIGILRHQQKTGRLLIEYPKAPGSFFFQEGELVDVQLDGLAGLQAICVAMAQPPAPFNFNPLIRPSQKSIDSSMRQVVSELFGCWDETPLQLETVIRKDPETRFERPAIQEAPSMPALRGPEVLALPPYVAPGRSNRTIFAMGAAGLLLLGISSIIAVSGGFQSKVESVSLAASSTGENRAPASEKTEPAPALPAEVRRSTNPSHESSRAREPQPLTQERPRASRPEINSEHPTTASVTGVSPGAESAASVKATTAGNPGKGQSIDVVMRIENGRVLQAAVANHKAGMDGYEALALRIARQRRYAPKASGQETVRIRVTQPE